jgi:hypothetical protein
LLPNTVSQESSTTFSLSDLEGLTSENGLPRINVEVLMHLTKRHYLMVGGLALLLVALGVAAAALPHRSKLESLTVPEDTPIPVTLEQGLASDQNRPGDHFEATVSQPVLIDGKTVIPQGAYVEGLVVDAHHAGRIAGRARLQLALETVTVDGKNYDVRTWSRWSAGGNHKKRNFTLIGGGTAGGALIGAIAGGGKGALIGGPVGAGAGTAVAFFTGKKDIHLRPETPLTFKLREPVTISVKG